MTSHEIIAVYEQGGTVWQKDDTSPLSEAAFPSVFILSKESRSTGVTGDDKLTTLSCAHSFVATGSPLQYGLQRPLLNPEFVAVGVVDILSFVDFFEQTKAPNA